MKGFLIHEWSTFLKTETTDTRPIKGTHLAFFSKLIVIVWSAQTTLWKAYQERCHSTLEDREQDNGKNPKIKEEITYLFSLCEQTLPAHHQTYFPQDLDTFLRHSTQTQLKNYMDWRRVGNSCRNPFFVTMVSDLLLSVVVAILKFVYDLTVSRACLRHQSARILIRNTVVPSDWQGIKN
jgi:hypothetical protein